MLTFRGLLEAMKDPCWKGYKAIGTKKKNGRKVPNCVPEDVSEAKQPQPRKKGSVKEYSQKEKDRINDLAKRPVGKLAKPPRHGMKNEDVEQTDENFVDNIKGAVKSIKRGLKGWDKNMIGLDGKPNTPKNMINRHKSYDNNTLKKLRGNDTPDDGSPRSFQKKVIDRELRRRNVKEEVEQVDELMSRRQLNNVASNTNTDKNSALAKPGNKTEKTGKKAMSYRAYFMKKAVNSHDEGDYDRRDKLKRSSKAWKGTNEERALNKPYRTPGEGKKFAVRVKNEKGNEVTVRFGDPNMTIKKNIPARRKSFRARHNCDNPGPKTKARYWSCRNW